MSRSLLAVAATFVAGSFLVVASPFGQSAPSPSAWSQDEEEEGTVLAGHMDGVNRTLRSLRKSLKEPSFKDASLEQLAQLQQVVLAAKLEVPARLEEVESEEAQAEFMAGYRAHMCKFLIALLELEQAVLADDFEGAQERLASLGDYKKVGHKAYK